jgi:hypothetical protein
MRWAAQQNYSLRDVATHLLNPSAQHVYIPDEPANLPAVTIATFRFVRTPPRCRLLLIQSGQGITTYARQYNLVARLRQLGLDDFRANEAMTGNYMIPRELDSPLRGSLPSHVANSKGTEYLIMQL